MEMTEGAVKVAVHRVRERYRNQLRERVAQTVACDPDLSAEEANQAIDEELNHLMSLFAS